MPSAVGGDDFPFQPRWRRPEDDDLPLPRAQLATWIPSASQVSNLADHQAVGPACPVKLSDIARALVQRIESQFRRDWAFAPAVWNLFFREKINLGISLSVKRNADVASHDCETDAAMAAADLFQKLERGSYMYTGKRRK